jgi:hypothetical protein
MLGPGAFTAAAGLSAFGVFFLSLLAILISSGYPYVGEWYTTSGEGGAPALPLADQQELVVGALWQAVFVYMIIGGVSAVGLVLHRIRR